MRAIAEPVRHDDGDRLHGYKPGEPSITLEHLRLSLDTTHHSQRAVTWPPNHVRNTVRWALPASNRAPPIPSIGSARETSSGDNQVIEPDAQHFFVTAGTPPEVTLRDRPPAKGEAP